METKAILWVRVSTNKQEVESQKEDLIRLAIREGFKEENLITIEAFGASAVKEDELYLKEKDRLINYLETDKDITTVFIWEVSRLARQEDTFHTLKRYFVEHKIQLIVYNPFMKLLEKNEKGELVLDEKVTYAFSMLAAQASAESRIRAARTSRGRERNTKAGKFNGGKVRGLFGYTVNEEGYIVPNPEEAKVVELIFSEYATGKYSVKKLAEEMRNRGYSLRNGKKMNDTNLNFILANPTYAGLNSNLHYKPLITEKLYKKVEGIRKRNTLGISISKESKYSHLATQILKCKHCGYSYSYSNHKYICYKHQMGHRFEPEEQCKESVGVSQPVVDSILWDEVKRLEVEYVKNLNAQSIPVLRKEAVVLEEKIKATETRINAQFEKRERAIESQIEGDITKERLNTIKAKVEAEVYSITEERKKLQQQLQLKKADIAVLEKFPKSGKGLAEVLNFDKLSDKEKKDLVVKHILTVTAESKTDNYGKKIVELVIFTKKETVIRYWYYYTLKNRKKQIVRQ